MVPSGWQLVEEPCGFANEVWIWRNEDGEVLAWYAWPYVVEDGGSGQGSVFLFVRGPRTRWSKDRACLGFFAARTLPREIARDLGDEDLQCLCEQTLAEGFEEEG